MAPITTQTVRRTQGTRRHHRGTVVPKSSEGRRVDFPLNNVREKAEGNLATEMDSNDWILPDGKSLAVAHIASGRL